jgi:hypothetical protein
VSSIIGSPIQYAGGGGGGGGGTSIGGLGTAGGGNSGQGTNTGGVNAVVNTGGGGGGSNGSGGLATYPNLLGGAGGSGIVIIRYPRNLAPPASTTGNPQILYNNGYQIYIWTSSGSITF